MPGHIRFSTRLNPGRLQTVPEPGTYINYNCMVSCPVQYHTHYTVGGKCIYHQHIMDADSTLREFEALKISVMTGYLIIYYLLCNTNSVCCMALI